VSETSDLVETGAHAAAGTTEASAASGTTGSARRRGNGLSGMLLPELQRLAAELGIAGTCRMRKGDLVAAISARQVGGSAPSDAPSSTNGTAPAVSAPAPVAAEPLEAPVSGGANGGPVTGSSADVSAPVRDTAGLFAAGRNPFSHATKCSAVGTTAPPFVPPVISTVAL